MHYKLIYYIIFISLFFSTSGFICNPSTDGMISIENQSNKELVVYITTNYPNEKISFSKTDSFYLSEKLYEYKQYIYGNTYDILQIKPHMVSAKSAFARPFCSEVYWHKRLRHDTLVIYFIDRSKLNSKLEINEAILEKRYITYKDIIMNNCLITYK